MLTLALNRFCVEKSNSFVNLGLNDLLTVLSKVGAIRKTEFFYYSLNLCFDCD